MISVHDQIVCDNGKTYNVKQSYENNGFDYKIVNNDEIVTEIKSWHLNDCYTYDEPFCYENYYGELKYTKIISVYDYWGNLKYSKNENVRSKLPWH